MLTYYRWDLALMHYLGIAAEMIVWGITLFVLLKVLKRGYGGVVQGLIGVALLPSMIAFIDVLSGRWPTYAGGPILKGEWFGAFETGIYNGAGWAAAINFGAILIVTLIVAGKTTKKLLKKLIEESE